MCYSAELLYIFIDVVKLILDSSAADGDILQRELLHTVQDIRSKQVMWQYKSYKPVADCFCTKLFVWFTAQQCLSMCAVLWQQSDYNYNNRRIIVSIICNNNSRYLKFEAQKLCQNILGIHTVHTNIVFSFDWNDVTWLTVRNKTIKTINLIKKTTNEDVTTYFCCSVGAIIRLLLYSCSCRSRFLRHCSHG